MCCAQWVAAQPPAVAIIIDDIGNNYQDGERVINFRWPLTCSILPARPYSIELAQLARKHGKEVMVHLPMQAIDTQSLGIGALTANMPKQVFETTVNTSIDAVPYASGINNHMGSLLTSNEKYMDWLMQTIANRDENLFFIDSKTSAQTIAADVAYQYHIPTLKRDVFLDTEANDKAHIRKQVKRLIEVAKTKGYALAIGHPNKSTLITLEQELSKLAHDEIQFVSVSELIQIASENPWPTYSYLSPKDVKNSKQLPSSTY